MYSNLTNSGNYQLAAFGQKGFKLVDSSNPTSGHFNTIQALTDTIITVVSVKGDSLTDIPLTAGLTIFGLFTTVSTSEGQLLAYVA
jgi:hypothetical protein